MICAKIYETVFKFVKVMPIVLVASFFPDTVYVMNYDFLYISIFIWKSRPTSNPSL